MSDHVQYNSFEEYPAYEAGDLELIYTPEKSIFKIWSPSAEAAKLRLYDTGLGGSAFAIHPMEPASDGTWSVEVTADLMGKFYTFQTKHDGEWLAETPGIYAKAVGVNGMRAAIIDMRRTDPDGWDTDTRPLFKNATDAILYEIHVRDFSADPCGGMKHRGKFLAFTETGTVNEFGQKTGLDHLTELGITHIHLMPAFDFATIDETKPDSGKYNWGYDPANYNVPEGSYATDAADPYCRIREFKQMIQALHSRGIRVVMDVVYNHTYHTEKSNFNQLVPGYYYRQNANGSYSNASGCGNETASERTMVRRFIIDSVKYWATEYHVDGFRFDLMAIHDIETMNAVRRALDEIEPGMLIYGEGWTAGDSPLPYEWRAVKQHLDRMPGIAAFSDDLRDALKGTWANAHECGFAAGHQGYDESVKFGVVAATPHDRIHYGLLNYSNAPYATEPSQVINYVSCHDDLCLYDKLAYSAPYGTQPNEMQRYIRLAQTIIFTSQGIPFMYGGEELSRTKKGIHNTYQSPDSINQLYWNQKKTGEALFTYYKSLIHLRRNHPAFRMPRTEMLQQNLHFIDTRQACVVAFLLENNAGGDRWNRILVVYNGNRNVITLNIPKDNWMVACNGEEIRENGISKWSNDYLTVPPSSAMILFKA
ncbi:MAG: type I pullulanase [Paludibacteraceae bacterium]|nr:type I pullulanase [Paludibacteraceae bacterium]